MGWGWAWEASPEAASADENLLGRRFALFGARVRAPCGSGMLAWSAYPHAPSAGMPACPYACMSVSLCLCVRTSASVSPFLHLFADRLASAVAPPRSTGAAG